MFAFRITERRTVLIAIDLIIVELTTLLAFWIMAVRGGRTFDRAYLLDQIGWFVFLPVLWFLSAFLNDFYNPKKMIDLATAALSLLRSIALVVIVYLFIYFFFAIPGSLPRGVVGYQGAASFVLITLWRTAYVLLVQRPAFARKVVIIGAGWSGQIIAKAIGQSASAYYRILGFVDDDPTR
ncbi:MAG: hypothetical protein KGJ80_21300, partial [Chloroflexota bacterium]|nr:hypothetical protein [Chloroflexota bacterium]